MFQRPGSMTVIIAVLALVSAPILSFSEVFASEPFLSEIRMFAGNFAPRSWAFCDGQLLSISQNDALFSLVGTTYGGDGRTTFGLPDMRGRVPMHWGQGPGLTSRACGQKLGSETAAISLAQLPAHNHVLRGSTAAGNSTSPANASLANDPREDQYITGQAPDVNMGTGALTTAGGGQEHPNMQPSLCVHFIIAVYGIYPSRQ